MKQENNTFLRSTLMNFIPFIVMSLLVISFLEHSFSMLESDVAAVSQGQMQSVVAGLEDNISDTAAVASDIYLDPALSAAQLAAYEQPTVDGIAQLGAYQRRLSLYSTIFVSYWPDRAVSSVGTVSYETLTQVTLQLSAHGEQQFRDAMQSGEFQHVALLETETDEHYLFVVYYYPGGTRTAERWIGFLINADELQDEVQSALRATDGVAVLCYGDRPIAETVSPAASGAPETVADCLARLRAGADKFAGYSIFNADAPRLDLTLRVALNNSTLKSDLIAEEIKMIVIGVLVFVAMAVFLWLASRYNYQPIQKIKEIAQSHMPDVERAKHDSDFDFIRKALEQNFAKQSRQEELFRRFQRETRKQMGWLLLSGAVPEELRSPEMIEYFGLQADAPYYAAIGVRLMAGAKFGPHESDRICEIPGVLTCYMIQGGAVSVLAALQTRDADCAVRRALAEQIQAELRAQDIPYHYAACGMVYEQLTDVHQSQKEMQTALGAALDSDELVRFFENLARVSGKPDHRASERLLKFRAELRGGHADRARAVLDELLPCVGAGEERFVRYVIVQTLLEAHQDAAADAQPEALLALVGLDNDAFHREIDRLLAQMFRSAEDSDRTLDGDAVVAYVRANFANPELSQDAVAAHFRCSTKSVTRVIKKKQGCSYQDFLTALRMKRACELLLTGLDTQKIVERVGYYDLSSFNRRFKSIFGVPPREWRAQHQSDRES